MGPSVTGAATKNQTEHDGPASGEHGPMRPVTSKRYLLGAEIARGGMGAVLQAMDREMRREVAVKYLLDQGDHAKRLRFVEEAQITGQLEHPNIVPIHELVVDAQSQLYFAMKMVKGRSLAQVLGAMQQGTNGDSEYTLPRLLTVFVGVCNALAYAHSRGVVHRDLKPSNVMIGDFGEVYVMDWGLAKVLRDAPGAPSADSAMPSFAVEPKIGSSFGELDKVVTSRQQSSDLTQEGAILGTASYMPPEQAFGEVNAVDERSDVYALGAILYEILTLQPPIDKSGSRAAIIGRVIEGKIVPPAVANPERARAGNIPPELSAIAMKAMAHSPTDRYQSVEFLRRDIERFLEGRSVSAKEDSRAELLRKFIKRNKAASVASAAAALVLAIVVTWALFINLRARRDAENAYSAYETEQREKEARTRQAVPALVKAAQLEAQQLKLNDALRHVNLALEYDPAYADGRLLKSQLLIVQQDFPGAAAELGKFLAFRPKDTAARELKQLCQEVQAGDDEKSVLVQMSHHLEMQSLPTLAEALLQRHGGSDAVRHELLIHYRTRLAAAWPLPTAKVTNPAKVDEFVPEVELSLDDNRFRLKLLYPNARDLTPLKGMPLHSIELQCPDVRDLSPLRGMPLREFTLKKSRGVDLAALAGMRLTSFQLVDCHGSLDLGVLDGMPLGELLLEACSGFGALPSLADMPLTAVRINGCAGLSDLSGLRGASLKTLVVTSCPNIRDLAPLKDMPLTVLNLAGCTSLQDLAPLKAMPLTELYLSGTEVADLSPLRGMPLTKLELDRCALVQDLSSLKGLKLRWLQLGGCARVDDIASLAGMPLADVSLAGTDVKDLAPLAGMPLNRINLNGCRSLTSLAALKGAALNSLDLTDCRSLTDLSPLGGMRLNWLSLAGCGEVADLTPLQGIPLNSLSLAGCAKVPTLSPLKSAVLTNLELRGCRSIKNLVGLAAMRFDRLELVDCAGLTSLDGLRGSSLTELHLVDCAKLERIDGLQDLRIARLTIDNCPNLYDFAGLAGLSLTEAKITNCPKVTELNGLRGLPLNVLDLSGCVNVADLAPLAGVPLRKLNLTACGVKELTSLKEMGLQSLQLDKCLELHDLRPIGGLRLTEIRLPPQVTAGLDALRKMPTLERIDGLPAAHYWRQLDHRKQPGS
jgi:serine/threonine protein kinase